MVLNRSLNDLYRVKKLEKRRQALLNSNLDDVYLIYWLLEDCKRYGTLPFAGLARAAFIAVQLLDSLVSTQELTKEERDSFFLSLNTLGSQMKRDLHALSREDFLGVYGHLRPGTYDIRSERYDEAPDLYFDWGRQDTKIVQSAKMENFSLPNKKRKSIDALLQEHGLGLTTTELFEFMKKSIEGREFAKFMFTRNLSKALSLFEKLGNKYGFSQSECSFANIDIIHELYLGSRDPQKIFAHSINAGRENFDETRRIVLPPLIQEQSDAWQFHLPKAAPNFITQKRITGMPMRYIASSENLSGKIVFIENADPGYDWIFSRNISGFVTM